MQHLEVNAEQITKALAPVRQSIEELRDQVEHINIESEEDAGQVADLVKAARTRKKKVWDDKEGPRRQLVDPLNAHVKWINDQFKPERDALDGIVEAGTAKLDEWQKEQARIRQQEYERQKREQEEAALAAAAEAEKAGDRETAERTLDFASQAPAEAEKRSVRSDMGSTAYQRKVRRVRVTDWRKVPVEFLKLDERAALAAYKEGVQVPGLEFYDDQKTVVR